jgi:hypothetical protein
MRVSFFVPKALRGDEMSDVDDRPVMTMVELYEYLHYDEGLPVTLSGVREAVRRREIEPTRLARGNYFSQKDGWDWIRSRKQSGNYSVPKPAAATQ